MDFCKDTNNNLKFQFLFLWKLHGLEFLSINQLILLAYPMLCFLFKIQGRLLAHYNVKAYSLFGLLQPVLCSLTIYYSIVFSPYIRCWSESSFSVFSLAGWFGSPLFWFQDTSHSQFIWSCPGKSWRASM